MFAYVYTKERLQRGEDAYYITNTIPMSKRQNKITKNVLQFINRIYNTNFLSFGIIKSSVVMKFEVSTPAI